MDYQNPMHSDGASTSQTSGSMQDAATPTYTIPQMDNPHDPFYAPPFSNDCTDNFWGVEDFWAMHSFHGD